MVQLHLFLFKSHRRLRAEKGCYYLHDSDIGSLMLLSRFGQPCLQTADCLFQMLAIAIESFLDILIYNVVLHLEEM